MRCLLVLGLAASMGCGDNEPACGHAQLMVANRNIWGGQIALDDERIYYSDYDNGADTHLVFRQPREGGQPLVIAARDHVSRFGFGMATDAKYLYWSGDSGLTGYILMATPLLGGATLELGGISPCTAHGVAVDSLNAYAGAVRCNDGTDVQSRVVAVPHDGTGAFEVWTSATGDVSAIAAQNGTIWIAATNGLYRVSSSGRELLDGQPSYHVVIANDEVVYSTEEAVKALPLSGGAARTLYTFHTPLDQPRAFAIDGDDLYVVEPPTLVLVTPDAEPVVLVKDMGGAITHIVAGSGSVYWPTLALPGSVGLLDTFSGGVMRVRRPCD